MGVLFMNIKVLGIAPYKGLGDVLIDLAKDEKSITFQLEVGDLRSGVALAEQAEAQGMDIIMSHGDSRAYSKTRQHSSGGYPCVRLRLASCPHAD